MLAFHYRPSHYTAAYTPPTWADGTNAEIVEAIAKADADEIDLSDYWSVGDERTVSLGVNADLGASSKQEQNVIFVIMDTGAESEYTDINDKYVNFVIGQKNCLRTLRTLGSNYLSSWGDCQIKGELNNQYYNSIDITFKSIFKNFKTKYMSSYTDTTIATSNDYFSLFAECEVVGNSIYNTIEREALEHIQYYKTASHRVKTCNGSTQMWWTRSFGGRNSKTNKRYFACIGTDGNSNMAFGGDTSLGLAPFGCI